MRDTKGCLYLIITIILLCLGAGGIHGQEYAMLHYTVNEGLPGNVVYSVYRDRKGFMWIGTDKGIARYNGIRFEVFTTFGGVPDNEVLFFQEDPYGRLWLGTYSGQLCYYKDDTFHTAANTPFLRTVQPAKAFTKNIYIQADSSLNFEYSEGLYFVNIKNTYCKTFSLAQQYRAPMPYSILMRSYKKSANEYVLVSNRETITIDSNSNTLTYDSTKYIPSSSSYSENQNQLYLIDSKITLFSGKNKISWPNKYEVRAVYYDRKDVYLVTKDGRLFINDDHVPVNGMVSSVTQDQKGNYWISTVGSGIYILDKNFRSSKVYKNAFSNTVKICKMLGDSILFYGTAHNLYSFKHGSINTVADYSSLLGLEAGKLNHSIFSIDDKSTLFTFCNYLIHIIPYAGCYKKRSVKLLFDRIENGKTIAHVGGRLYVTTHNRIIYIEDSFLTSNRKIQYKEIINDKERIFYTKERLADSSFWFSTISGIYKIDRAGNQKRISTIALKCFEFIGEKLVGYTHSNDLLVLDNLNGRVTSDSVRSENCIWNKLYVLDKDRIIIGTNNLYRLVTLFPAGANKIDSISTIESEFAPLYADAISADKTNLYFFKDSAITVLNIRDLLLPAPPPRLFWGHVSTAKNNFLVTDIIGVPFNESGSIKISFSVLSLGSRTIRCEYSVSRNGEDHWEETTVGEINLIHPDYGNYTIKVRAQNRSGQPGQPISFLLEIQRPFWATAWFITSGICLGIIVVFLTVVITRRLVLVKAKKKHQHIELELRSVYAQLNPHFIFNSLNAAMYLVQAKRFNEAYQHIYKFSNLLRSYIKSSRNRFITLDEEIKNLRNYIDLQLERFNNKFSYDIFIDDEVDTGTSIPSLLIQPLVENAITHGLRNKKNKGYLKISFIARDNGDILECIIDDDGVGRGGTALKDEHDMPKGESYGSHLIDDLINIMNKGGEIKIDIEYIDKLNPITGTVVRLKIKKLHKK